MGRRASVAVALVSVAAVEAYVSAVQRPRFRAETAAVRLEVSVFDRRGTVTGLKAADFVVFDNGAEVREFAAEELIDLPLDIVLVAQSFSSLLGVQPDRFESAIRSLFRELRPADRLALLVTSSPPSGLHALAPAGGDFDPAVVSGTSESALWDTVALGLGEFRETERRKVLMVVADGTDRRSVLNITDTARLASFATSQIVFIGSAPTQIDHIRLRSDPETYGAMPNMRLIRPELNKVDVTLGNRFPSRELRDLAASTGGQVIDLISADPQPLIALLVSRLRRGYLITYSRRAGPGWHSTRVQVKRPNVTVITRAGYFAN